MYDPQTAARDALTTTAQSVTTLRTTLSTAIAALLAQANTLQHQLDAGLLEIEAGLRVAQDDLEQVTVALDTTGATRINAAMHAALALAKTATADQPLRLFIGAGTYRVNPLDPFRPLSHTWVVVDPEAKFMVEPNDKPGYQVWNCERVRNVRISGGQYYGDRDQHAYIIVEPDKAPNDGQNTHEWGHAFRVSGCFDCSFSADYIANFTGDAFSIGAFKNVYPWVRSERVLFHDTVVEDCRRQGISIGGVNGVTLRKLVLNNIGRTNGTSPRCGIDLEPDTDKQMNKDGTVKREETRAGWCDDVTIEDCTIDGAAVFGVNIFLRVQKVQFKNSTIKNSLSAGIKNVNGLDVHVLGGYIGLNGNVGLNFPAGTSGKVAGVVFDRNVVRLHPEPRPTPIIASGIVANTKHDLTVNSGATVDLSETNEYR